MLTATTLVLNIIQNGTITRDDVLEGLIMAMSYIVRPEKGRA